MAHPLSAAAVSLSGSAALAAPHGDRHGQRARQRCGVGVARREGVLPHGQAARRRRGVLAQRAWCRQDEEATLYSNMYVMKKSWAMNLLPSVLSSSPSDSKNGSQSRERESSSMEKTPKNRLQVFKNRHLEKQPTKTYLG